MQHRQSNSINTDALSLSDGLVASLRRTGHIRSAAVESAFRAVPRHLFLPDVPLNHVYNDQAFTTKFLDGRAVSSSSQPTVMATMLEQLQLKPGHRVLEIGAGTGYNAALMAQIVGDTGQVVTIDIDDDIVAEARAHLVAAGFDRVKVVCGDGVMGYPSAGPYDRIILTVGADDIAPAWQAQLADGGRLVVPLVLRVRQKSVAFEQVGSSLTSVSVRGGILFMPLRGALVSSDNIVHLGADANLTLAVDDARHLNVAAVRAALKDAGSDWTTEVQVAPAEVEEGLGTWLELREPNFCYIFATGRVAEDNCIPDLLGSSGRFRSTFGLRNETTLALLMRPVAWPNDTDGHPAPAAPSFPLMIRVMGPDQSLAQQLLDEIRAWEGASRPTDSELRIRAYPLESSARRVAGETGVVLTKRETRLVCDWS